MFRFKKKKGVILIVSTLLLGVLLTLGAYFLTFTTTESKISKSQSAAVQTYYLAEAGVSEAIWKIKNDPVWKENFITPPACYNWFATSSGGSSLSPNGYFNIQIQNTDCGRGEIISTAIFNLPNGKTAQRIVKTKVFKAIGSLVGDSAVLSSGSSENIDLTATAMNVYDGNLSSNNNLNIGLFSNIDVYDNPDTEKLEGKTLAKNNLIVSWGSTLDTLSKCAKNVCQGDCTDQGCPPVAIPMPMIDFDSGDPGSYKSKAAADQAAGHCSVLCNGVPCDNKCIYTDKQFSDLLWTVGKNGTLTLNNGITYITGPLDLKGSRRLVINGILLADGTVSIGENDCWTVQGKKDCGNDQVTVNDPGMGEPSGILTKGKMNFGLYSSFQNMDIRGLLYASDEIKFVSLPWLFRVYGGIIGRKFSVISIWASLNVHLDNTIITEAIWGGSQPPEGGTPPFSPVVTIEHWEESY
jgi:hypothetical protein